MTELDILLHAALPRYTLILTPLLNVHLLVWEIRSQIIYHSNQNKCQEGRNKLGVCLPTVFLVQEGNKNGQVCDSAHFRS